MNAHSLRRLWVFLRRTTLLDRLALIVIAADILWQIASARGIKLPYGGLLAFLGAVAVIYFVVRLIPWVRRNLMWRLRNRLIVAYLFIAVVPVVLLLSMAGLASYLIYLQLGAHLLEDDLNDRAAMVMASAESLADAIEKDATPAIPPDSQKVLSLPGVAALVGATRAEFPNCRILLNREGQLPDEGTGRGYAGLSEQDEILYISAVAKQMGRQGPVQVLLEVPVTPALLDTLSSELGPVRLILLEPAKPGPAGRISIGIDNQVYVPGQEISSRKRSVGSRANFLDVRINGASTLKAVSIPPHASMATSPVLASFAVRASAINRRLFRSVGALGPILIRILEVVGFIFLAMEIAALVTGIVLTRTITRAVGDLYEATLHVRRGDFSHRIRVHQQDQLGALGESFNEMTSSITELIEDQRQKQKLENEISIAREVQEQLFPKEIPSLPALDLAAICRAARTVSGDYYDFIRLGRSQVGMALADISGKGIFAALLMASLQASLRSQATQDGNISPAELVARINRHIYLNTTDDRYATFFYAVYDGDAKTLTYTNAGHLAPFFITDSGCEELSDGGTVVGLFEEFPYTQRTLHVKPGAVLVAFSDGLSEPENVYGEEFGVARLREEATRLRHLSAAKMAKGLIAVAEQWAGTAEQADDMTVLVARMG
ncbi:MAG TPA: SpoIIE family protein phosphatase [Verrucomicrobiae bacterium]|nr:SpoIIE family protein phosphatase [Verrucomicrobiae bacterium]